MSGIIGTDGKIISNETFEVDGFKFGTAQIKSNPILALIAMICIDPTDKQKEFLDKACIVLKDVDGKQIFPKEEEQES